MPRPKKVPAYRHHKPSGQAVTTVAGRDVYLGGFGSPKSHQAYRRVLKHWAATGQLPEKAPPPLSINDLMARYWVFAEGYYQRDGEPTGEINNIRYALRPLHDLFGDTPARTFGPKALKTLQHSLVESGLCRNVVNRRICKIKRMFKWAVSEQLLPPRVYQGLATVEGLKKHRTVARETPPVAAVSDETIEATLPYMPSVVQDMVRIQRWTGCRPGELCGLRPQDVDQTKQPWVFRPARHKVDYLDQQRLVLIGPQAQAVQAKYLQRPPEQACFSPAESESARKVELRQKRKTRVQPSQRDRSKASAQRRPGTQYTRQAYMRAILRACQKAGVPHWSPNRIRHRCASAMHEKYGLEIAQQVLGHRKPNTTLIYLERQLQRAAEAVQTDG